MRYPRKRDDNEREIVHALRELGASVSHLDDTGVPDLLVGYRGQTLLLEVKLPTTKAGRAHARDRGELTEAQAKWWDAWCGEEPAIVHSVEEAVTIVTGCVLSVSDGRGITHQ